MKATFNLRSVVVFACLIVIGVGIIGMVTPRVYAASGPMTGWLWSGGASGTTAEASGGIGWVSLNCSNTNTCGAVNYALSVGTNGIISGYAWSENIGWVSANSADLAGCPTAPCTAVLQSGALSGWLKALSGGTAESGGWDGWISLSGASPSYGPTESSGVFSGYAWGSDIVGWVYMSTTTTTTSPDLAVSGITPTSAVAGATTTFSATVSNIGLGSTGIGFKNFYQVKSGTTAYAPQNFFAKLFNIANAAEVIEDLPEITISALSAGSSGVVTQTYKFLAGGTYGIRVCADKENRNGTNGNPNGEIPEADESNNCGGWTNVTVDGGTCTPVCGGGSVCSSGACVIPGTPCTPTNACGQSNSGTLDSAGVCSVSAPLDPDKYNEPCPSPKNTCEQFYWGAFRCDGSCSVTTPPPDTQCIPGLPTVTLTANPTLVSRGSATKLTWTSSNATSCNLTGTNGFSRTTLSGTDIPSGNIVAQTTFTLTCSNASGNATKSVVVRLIPSFIER